MTSLNKGVSRPAGAAVVVCLALLLPATAFAQATRTWVSGVGDDANPCSRTAPCKTFAGAIAKTAPGGEINVLDPGGFGALTITKSITVSAIGSEAGVLVSGTNGIVIAAGANDHVTLRGLDFEGLGTGLDGIKVLSAGNVRIEDSTIDGFVQNGIEVAAGSPATTTNVEISGTDIYNNAGNGVLIDPAGGTVVKAAMVDDNVENNNCGVVAAAYGAAGQGTQPECGVNTGTGAGQAARVAIFSSTIDLNNLTTTSGINGSSAVLTEGNGARSWIADNNIIGNLNGLSENDGGVITSLGNNNIVANTNNGSPTSPGASPSSVRSHRSKHRHSAKHHKAK